MIELEVLRRPLGQHAGGEGTEVLAPLDQGVEAFPGLGAARVGEETSMKGLAGAADVADVVTAVTNAEVALQTVMAVRDRVIQAYQDIIRMPI